jgi:hypothetical protein
MHHGDTFTVQLLKMLIEKIAKLLMTTIIKMNILWGEVQPVGGRGVENLNIQICLSNCEKFQQESRWRDIIRRGPIITWKLAKRKVE